MSTITTTPITLDAPTRSRIAAIDATTAHGDITEARTQEVYARVALSHSVSAGTFGSALIIRVIGAWNVLELLHDSAASSPTTIARRIIDAFREADSDGHDLSDEQIASTVRDWQPRLSYDDVFAALGLGQQHNMTVILPGDPFWPAQLETLGDYHAPIMLWTIGDPTILGKQTVALVGARAATGYGTHITAELAEGLAAEDVTIVSGGAYGIDAAAHRTSLANGGTTAVIAAGGLDRTYPQAHGQLYEKIALLGGVIVSEFPPAPCSPGTGSSRGIALSRHSQTPPSLQKQALAQVLCTSPNGRPHLTSR